MDSKKIYLLSCRPLVLPFKFYCVCHIISTQKIYKICCSSVSCLTFAGFICVYCEIARTNPRHVNVIHCIFYVVFLLYRNFLYPLSFSTYEIIIQKKMTVFKLFMNSRISDNNATATIFYTYCALSVMEFWPV